MSHVITAHDVGSVLNDGDCQRQRAPISAKSLAHTALGTAVTISRDLTHGYRRGRWRHFAGWLVIEPWRSPARCVAHRTRASTRSITTVDV